MENKHTALGMFKDEKTGMYQLAVFTYDETGNVEFVEFKELNKDRNISRDQFKVSVVEKGIIKP